MTEFVEFDACSEGMRGLITYNRDSSEWGVKYSLWPPLPWPHTGKGEPTYYPPDEYHCYHWDGEKVVATPTEKYYQEVARNRWVKP
jgi:hypothetical protein